MTSLSAMLLCVTLLRSAKTVSPAVTSTARPATTTGQSYAPGVQFLNIVPPVATGAILANKQCLFFTVSGPCNKTSVDLVTNVSSFAYTITIDNNNDYPAKILVPNSIKVAQCANNYYNYINCTGPTTFWLTWVNNLIIVGRGSSIGQQMMTMYQAPLNVTIQTLTLVALPGSSWSIPHEFFSSAALNYSCSFIPYTVDGNLTGLYSQKDRYITYNSSLGSNYMDVGIDLSGRQWVIFQAMSCTGVFFALTYDCCKAIPPAFVTTIYGIYYEFYIELTMLYEYPPFDTENYIIKDQNVFTSYASSPGQSCSCGKYQWYWISWINNYLAVGTGTLVGHNILLYNNFPVVALMPFRYLAVNGWNGGTNPGQTSTFIIPGYFYEPYTITTNGPSFIDTGMNLTSMSCITFSVSTCRYVVATLSSYSGNYATGVYNIYLDDDPSAKFANATLKITRDGDTRANVVSPSLVNQTSNWTFWITWSNGSLTVGLGPTGGIHPIMTYLDPSPAQINYLAFSGTNPAYSATWTVPQLNNPPSSPTCYQTVDVFNGNLTGTCAAPDRAFKYSSTAWNYVDVGINLTNNNWVVFQARSCYNVFVSLATNNVTKSPNYEVYFDYKMPTYATGYEHTIWKNKQQLAGSASYYGATANCSQYKWFWISWIGGVVRAGSGTQIGINQVVLFNDTQNPISVRKMGISSSPDSPSNWTIPGCFYSPVTTTAPPTTTQTTTTAKLTTAVSTTAFPPSTAPSTTTTRETTTLPPTTPLFTSDRSTSASPLSTAPSTTTTTTTRETTTLPPTTPLFTSDRSTSVSILQSSTTSLSSTTTNDETTTTFSASKTSPIITDISKLLPSTTSLSSTTTIDETTTTFSASKTSPIITGISTLLPSTTSLSTTATNDETTTTFTASNTSPTSTKTSSLLPSSTTDGNTTTSPVTTSLHDSTTREVSTISTMVATTSNEKITARTASATAPSSTTTTPETVTDCCQNNSSSSTSFWLPSEPTALLPCPSPNNAINTIKHVDNASVYHQFASYKCKIGSYFVEGGNDRSSVCPSGSWLPSSLNGCQVISCSIQPLVDGVLVTSTTLHMSYNDISTLNCPEQSVFDSGLPFDVLKCVGNGKAGTLHKQQSSCRVLGCQPPPLVANAVATFEPSLRKVTLVCIPGYRFSNGYRTRTYQCNADGSWDVVDRCQVIFCPALKAPVNGTLSSPDVVYGSVVYGQCYQGFMFPNGNITIPVQCIDNTTALDYVINGLLQQGTMWNDTLPDCQPIFCVSPPAITAATVQGLDSNPDALYSYGSIVIYTCLDSSMKFSDGRATKSITCGGHGLWTETVFNCSNDLCDPVPIVPNATPNTSLCLPNTTVSYACDEGYEYSLGVSVVRVQCIRQNWTWLDTPDSCKEITCPSLNIPYTTLNTTETTAGTVVDVACVTGYQLLPYGTRSRVVRCTISGSWLPSEITCQLVACDVSSALAIAGPQSLIVSKPDITTVNSSLTIGCQNGYYFSHNVFLKTVDCGVDGRWYPSDIGRCKEANCFPLLTQIVNHSSLARGATVNVTCLVGQLFSDGTSEPILSTCNDLGRWAPAIPDCVNKLAVKHIETTKTEVTNAQTVGAVIGCVCMGTLAAFFLFSDITTFTTNASKKLTSKDQPQAAQQKKQKSK